MEKNICSKTYYIIVDSWASLASGGIKNLFANVGDGFDPWVGKIPWRRERLEPPWMEEPGGLQSMGSQSRKRLSKQKKKSVPESLCCAKGINTVYHLYFNNKNIIFKKGGAGISEKEKEIVGFYYCIYLN